MNVKATNRKARHDYAISDTLVAGIQLVGSEVKSIRAGRVSLKGSYCTFQKGELYLRGATIAEYGPATNNHELTRDRKLLLTRRQLQDLRAKRQQGAHIVPLKIGPSGRFIKLEIGIGQARKKYDKRQKMKLQDDKKRAQVAANRR